MFESTQVTDVVNNYLFPWGINLLFALLIYVIGRKLASWVVTLCVKLMTRAKLDPMLINFVSAILNALLLLVIVIAALAQVGVNTSSFVAVLAAAGLAIGLSMQSFLQNFAAGVMLLVFKPFKAQNFVEVAGVMGIVEHINIFTTTLRSLDNKELIVPNGAIYGSIITNFSARDTRRIDMTFGISYDSDLKKAKEILNEIVAANPLILAEPAPIIRISELADSSVNFVVWPWVKASDLHTVRSEIIETVKLRFDAENISIPFPQMDVHVKKTAEE